MLSLLHDPVQITCHIWLTGLSVSFKMEQFCLFPLFLSFIIFSKSIGQLFCVMTLSLGSSLGSLWFDQVLDPRGDLSWGWHRMSVWPILVMVSLVRWLRRCRWDFSTGKSLFFPSVILWLINILGGKILAWSPFPHQTWDSTK